MVKYELHQDVIHKGKLHRIIGKDGKKLVIIEQGGNTALVVHPHCVIPAQEHKFQIGDQIESFYTFKGTVVGFEPDTGRILCLSDRHDRCQDTGRTRGGLYAYLPHEIRPREEFHAFMLNGQYKIRFEEAPDKSHSVRVLTHPHIADSFALYDIHSGHYLMAIARDVKESELFRFGVIKERSLC